MTDYDPSSIDLHPSWSLGFGPRPVFFDENPIDGWYYGFNENNQYVKSRDPDAADWIVCTPPEI